jgi:hypothetical protein
LDPSGKLIRLTSALLERNVLLVFQSQLTVLLDNTNLILYKAHAFLALSGTNAPTQLQHLLLSQERSVLLVTTVLLVPLLRLVSNVLLEHLTPTRELSN